MINRSMPVALAALLSVSAVSAGCTVPYTTPEQNLSVPYSTFVPKAANGVPLVTGLPAFADQPAPPVSFPVPAEAKKFNLQTVSLNLRVTNTGPLPLRITLFLAEHPNDPYASAPLGGAEGTLTIPRGGGTVEKAFPVDPALLKGDQLRLGYKFGSDGTNESVTFKETDRVDVNYKVSVTAKII